MERFLQKYPFDLKQDSGQQGIGWGFGDVLKVIRAVVDATRNRRSILLAEMARRYEKCDFLKMRDARKGIILEGMFIKRDDISA